MCKNNLAKIFLLIFWLASYWAQCWVNICLKLHTNKQKGAQKSGWKFTTEAWTDRRQINKTARSILLWRHMSGRESMKNLKFTENIPNFLINIQGYFHLIPKIKLMKLPESSIFLWQGCKLFNVIVVGFFLLPDVWLMLRLC